MTQAQAVACITTASQCPTFQLCNTEHQRILTVACATSVTFNTAHWSPNHGLVYSQLVPAVPHFPFIFKKPLNTFDVNEQENAMMVVI